MRPLFFFQILQETRYLPAPAEPSSAGYLPYGLDYCVDITDSGEATRADSACAYGGSSYSLMSQGSTMHSRTGYNFVFLIQPQAHLSTIHATDIKRDHRCHPSAIARPI